MSDCIRVRQTVLDTMLAEARRQPDLECCGLLAGREGLISEVLPAQNALASTTAYEIAPEELFDLFRRIRAEGFEHLGIYHSHPCGENAPSTRDVAAAFYPDAAYFIVSPAAPAVGVSRPVRAFHIRAGHVSELTIEVL